MKEELNPIPDIICYLENSPCSTLTQKINNKVVFVPRNLLHIADDLLSQDYAQKYRKSYEDALASEKKGEEQKWFFDRIAELAFHWLEPDGKIKSEILKKLQQLNQGLDIQTLAQQYNGIFYASPEDGIVKALRNAVSEWMPLFECLPQYFTYVNLLNHIESRKKEPTESYAPDKEISFYYIPILSKEGNAFPIELSPYVNKKELEKVYDNYFSIKPEAKQLKDDLQAIEALYKEYNIICNLDDDFETLRKALKKHHDLLSSLEIRKNPEREKIYDNLISAQTEIDAGRTKIPIEYIVAGQKRGAHGPDNISSQGAYWKFLKGIGIDNSEAAFYLWGHLHQKENGLFYLLSQLLRSMFSENIFFKDIFPNQYRIKIIWNSLEQSLTIEIGSVKTELYTRKNFVPEQKEPLENFAEKVDSVIPLCANLKISFSDKNQAPELSSLDLRFGINNPNRENLERLQTFLPALFHRYRQETKYPLAEEIWHFTQKYSNVFADIDTKMKCLKPLKNNQDIWGVVRTLNDNYCMLEKCSKTLEEIKQEEYGGLLVETPIAKFVFGTDSSILKDLDTCFLAVRNKNISLYDCTKEGTEEIVQLAPTSWKRLYDILKLETITEQKLQEIEEQKAEEIGKVSIYLEVLGRNLQQHTEEQEKLSNDMEKIYSQEKVSWEKELKKKEFLEKSLKDLQGTSKEITGFPTGLDKQIEKTKKSLAALNEQIENTTKFLAALKQKGVAQVEKINEEAVKYNAIVKKKKEEKIRIETSYLEQVGYQGACRFWRVKDTTALFWFEHNMMGTTESVLDIVYDEKINCYSILKSPYNLTYKRHANEEPEVIDQYRLSELMKIFERRYKKGELFIHGKDFDSLASLIKLDVKISQKSLESSIKFYLGKLTHEREKIERSNIIEEQRAVLKDLEQQSVALNDRIKGPEPQLSKHLSEPSSCSPLFFPKDGRSAQKENEEIDSMIKQRNSKSISEQVLQFWGKMAQLETAEKEKKIPYDKCTILYGKISEFLKDLIVKIKEEIEKDLLLVPEYNTKAKSTPKKNPSSVSFFTSPDVTDTPNSSHPSTQQVTPSPPTELLDSPSIKQEEKPPVVRKLSLTGS